MKRRVLALLLALATAFSLTACGGASSAANGSSSAGETGAADTEASDTAFSPSLDTEEEATVNILGPLDNFEALEAVISDFQEIYPNCEVLYSQIDTNLLGARLTSDTSVGLFMYASFRYQENPAMAEFCANLLEEDIDLSAVQDKSLNASIVDGKLIGVPAAQDTSGLLVNVSLLEDAGLSVPTNWSELLEACQVLKDKGYAPLQGYTNWDDGYSYLYLILLRNMLYVMLTERLDTGEDLTAFYAGEEGSAEFLQPMFEQFMTLMDKGYIDPEVNALYTDTYEDSILKFFEGDVPFLVCSTETYSGTKKRETKSEAYQQNSFEYEFICAPLAEDGAYTYMETWWDFCLNDKCENKEWALEFLRFLSTEEELNQLASIKGLPSTTEDSTDERFADLYPTNEALLKYESYVFPTVIEDTLSGTVMGLASGEIDTADASASYETILRDTLAEQEADSSAESSAE